MPFRRPLRYHNLMHRYVLHNDDVQDAQVKDTSPGQTGLMNGWGVFSTMRVADGVLFAFERHWARMRRDAERMRVPFPAEPDYLESRLLRLVEANDARNATLRVVVVRNRGGNYEAPDITRDFDVIAFTTGLNHWGDSVRLAVKPHARHAQNEFAGAKIMSWACNLAWYEEAHQRGFDEVVLLNERGEVCECTSANIFAERDGRVLTPPLNSGCLPGVTRELLLEEIRVAGITVHEQTLLPQDLEQAGGIFITSTTRDLLPVDSIEGLRIQQDSRAMEKLRQALIGYREEYVRNKPCSKPEPVYNH
jgi:branched-chain amino acid aminotransferase